MRYTAAAIVMLGTSLGACGSDGASFWTDTPVVDSSGILTNTDDFNDHLSGDEPPYSNDPVTAGTVFVNHGEPEANETVSVTSGAGAGSGETSVFFTTEGMQDDSVEAARYHLVFLDQAITGGTTGEQRLIFGELEFRCQPGRGQQDFAHDLCL